MMTDISLIIEEGVASRIYYAVHGHASRCALLPLDGKLYVRFEKRRACLSVSVYSINALGRSNRCLRPTYA